MTTTMVTSGTRHAGLDIRPITAPADNHGQPCAWCEAVRPVVTNLYYATTERGDYDETANTCEQLACVLAATEDHASDLDIIVELSMLDRPAAIDADPADAVDVDAAPGAAA